MNNNNSNIFGNNLNMNINNLQTNFNGLDSKYKIIIFAVFIVFLVFLGFIGYIYWTNYKTNKVQSFQEETLLDGMYDCNNRKSPMVIDASKIPASTMGSEYSLNIWIYVAEAQNRDGYVLKRGPAAGKIMSDCFPGIILKEDTNDMIIYFKKETGSNNADSVSTFTGDYTIEQFHSDEGRLVEGLENLEHFYGMNDELENNYIIEGFVAATEDEKNFFQTIGERGFNFQFAIPKDFSNIDNYSSELRTLIKTEDNAGGNLGQILDIIQGIIDEANDINLKIGDREILIIYNQLKSNSSLNIDSEVRDIRDDIDNIIENLLNAPDSSKKYPTYKITGIPNVSDATPIQISKYLVFATDITPTDDEKEEINKKIYDVHVKTDGTNSKYNDDNGALINQARVDKAKKELIKLFLKKTNEKAADVNKVVNITDVEMLEMRDLIFKKSTATNATELTNLATNVLHILKGIRNIYKYLLTIDKIVIDDWTNEQFKYNRNFDNYKDNLISDIIKNIVSSETNANLIKANEYETMYNIKTITEGSSGTLKTLTDNIKDNLVRDLKIILSGGFPGQGSGNDGDDSSIVEGNEITIHNIPLQRWTCLNISVFNQTVDIYVDGKLKTSEQFRKLLKPPGPLPMTLGPVHEDGNGGSGFNGYLSRIKYSNRALNPGQVRQRYEEGPRITKGLWESFKSFFSSSEENVEE